MACSLGEVGKREKLSLHSPKSRWHWDCYHERSLCNCGMTSGLSLNDQARTLHDLAQNITIQKREEGEKKKKKSIIQATTDWCVVIEAGLATFYSSHIPCTIARGRLKSKYVMIYCQLTVWKFLVLGVRDDGHYESIVLVFVLHVVQILTRRKICYCCYFLSCLLQISILLSGGGDSTEYFCIFSFLLWLVFFPFFNSFSPFLMMKIYIFLFSPDDQNFPSLPLIT